MSGRFRERIGKLCDAILGGHGMPPRPEIFSPEILPLELHTFKSEQHFLLKYTAS